ncbi:MAG: S9 family peptidase [Planctomycetes bacterium]|nr:S9 family peptidase [Planctomycetota bacterium]
MSIRTLCGFTAAVLGSLIPLACKSAERSWRDWPRPTYPQARTEAVVDTYHGQGVADPYRWLEDPDSAESRAWIEAQNALTQTYLAPIPARAELRSRLTELWNFERFGLPLERGPYQFMSRNDGLQNQSVLYVREGADGTQRVLLDPNTMSTDGTVALNGTAYSDDGRFMAYGVSDGGSDWTTWRVRDVATGQDLADELRWIKFSGAAWSSDGSGFFYSRYDAPSSGAELQAVNYNQKLYFHRLGQTQEQDGLVYKRDDHKEWSFNAAVTDDGRWLVIAVGEGTDPRNRLFVDDLAQPGWKIVELIPEFDASFDIVDNDGDTLWLMTDLDAPRGRVIAVDVRSPSRSAWGEVVPQCDEKLESVSFVGGHFLCRYLEDAHSVVRVHARSGAFEREVDLPGVGTASGFSGRAHERSTYYSFASFTTPTALYRYDITSGKSTPYLAPRLTFDPALYATEQVFYTSKDGTRVPLFISYKKGLERNGQNPTLLYGYGGFNVSLTPSFSPARLAWLERGGVYAVANLRGGGEYGVEWHKAGTKLRKQNVFDDFIAAAEYLIDQRWTSSERLAINGGSNGGLLVGAVLNQRPELFGAALPAVGVMDMLRFESFTIGWAWASDYGSVKNADEFAALRAYSPYHNVRAGAHYPPVMVTTADHDDRVVPAHSFKYAAALQAGQGGPAPILIRIDVRAGHGAGKPTSKLIEQAADEMAFLTRALGVD